MKFDDIRPYRDEEIPSAMQRIVNSEFFPSIASYVFPMLSTEQARERLLSFKTIYDFQSDAMSKVNEQIIARSITEFTYSGLSYLNPTKQYLFVSNHRDIMLDSSLLQYLLHQNGFPTTEITFGANLMSADLLIDIGKSNKMFRTERGGNAREFYEHSLYLSEYIRYAITEKKESVWIAQRNGRTKDGHDATDQGIIKMFYMSKPSDKIEALSELNIVPVAISYEWESCDILKTLEIYRSRGTRYVKKPGEDLNSILTGIMQPKGRVHIELCKPIDRSELESFADCVGSKFNKKVADLLDSRIYNSYLLTPNNYIAHDLRSGKDTYRCHYENSEKQAFLSHLSRLDEYVDCDIFELKEILLGIYANPIDNKLLP